MAAKVMKVKILKDREEITRKQAYKLIDALPELANIHFTYDPYGYYDDRSDVFMLDLLDDLEKHGLIDSYEVLKGMDPIPYEEGVIY